MKKLDWAVTSATGVARLESQTPSNASVTAADGNDASFNYDCDNIKFSGFVEDDENDEAEHEGISESAGSAWQTEQVSMHHITILSDI